MSRTDLTMYWFKVKNITPVQLFPYTTIVKDTIFWKEAKKLPEELSSVFQEIKRTIRMDYKVQGVDNKKQDVLWDNKIAVAIDVRLQNGEFTRMYMGYYDGSYVLGLSLDTESTPYNLVKDY